MESWEAINHADITAAASKNSPLGNTAHWIGLLAGRVTGRRRLFHKVIVANTALIAFGTILGIYMQKRYFAGGQFDDFLIPFIASGIALPILVNYSLMRHAFTPLEDMSDTMNSVLGGHRAAPLEQMTNDPQLDEFRRCLNKIIETTERDHRRLAASAIQAQEDERKRIARELHDETSHSLTNLLLGIKRAEESVPDSMAEVRERLVSIRELANAAFDEVQMMTVRLRPSLLDDLGLMAALRSHLKEFTTSTGISVCQQFRSMPERLSPEIETVIFRVVQEALTNVARHSGADTCLVMLERRGRAINCLITDNGKGFDHESVISGDGRNGLGLHGMRERVELVGGWLKLDSHPDQGCAITVAIPIEAEEGS